MKITKKLFFWDLKNEGKSFIGRMYNLGMFGVFFWTTFFLIAFFSESLFLIIAQKYSGQIIKCEQKIDSSGDYLDIRFMDSNNKVRDLKGISCSNFFAKDLSDPANKNISFYYIENLHGIVLNNFFDKWFFSILFLSGNILSFIVCWLVIIFLRRMKALDRG